MSKKLREFLDNYFALQQMTPAERKRMSDEIYTGVLAINQDLDFNFDKKNLKYGEIEMICDEHTVKVNSKKTKNFAKKEFMILHLLLQNPKKVISREIFLDRVWEENSLVIDRTVDVHMAKIKVKLGKSAASLIESVKGLGYRLKDIS
jgi:DNA-binding response OmpR family regulator